MAWIRHNKRTINLGRFDRLEDAVAAVAAKRFTLAWEAEVKAERERAEHLKRVWGNDVRRGAFRGSWARR
ncbi:hypothetical protein [Mycobacterium paraense]|uniref:hypothetical protein n=1 Tax=Mycobacterium paraense TaxID=767916 RepID=UPI001F4EF25D